MSHTQFPQALLNWYDQQGRAHLPWRQDVSAYRVWISEIMLQQTQVKTVIPYFTKFIACFPSITDLAQAEEDEILQLWTGLGYYSRARNLHKTAKLIVSAFQGNFPQTLLEMQSLPGIGRSTAGAILAIAMQQKTAILDGNVKRILSRLHLVEEKSQSARDKRLWELAEYYTPDFRTADYTQAIMDLGATICLRSSPRCDHCPVQSHCQAYSQQRVAEFPVRKKRGKLPKKAIHMLIFYQKNTQEVLLEKRPPIGIWGGLWSFPECSIDEDIATFCRKKYGYRIDQLTVLPEFKHTFSHFELSITPLKIEFQSTRKKITEPTKEAWHKLNSSNQARGFAAPVKRLLAEITSLSRPAAKTTLQQY